MPLFPFVRRILGIFHFVAELQKGVFDVVEACGGGFALRVVRIGGILLFFLLFRRLIKEWVNE